MDILRLILKVPGMVQTGPDSWQDTTKIKTFDLRISAPQLRSYLVKGDWSAIVIGAEVIEVEDEDA